MEEWAETWGQFKNNFKIQESAYGNEPVEKKNKKKEEISVLEWHTCVGKKEWVLNTAGILGGFAHCSYVCL